MVHKNDMSSHETLALLLEEIADSCMTNILHFGEMLEQEELDEVIQNMAEPMGRETYIIWCTEELFGMFNNLHSSVKVVVQSPVEAFRSGDQSTTCYGVLLPEWAISDKAGRFIEELECCLILP